MESAPPSNTNFIIEKSTISDKSMIEFAKMTILLAMQEYPDDDWKKCQLVCSKFEQKYGNNWCVSFIKNGEMTCVCYDFMKIRFKDYIIKIGRISDNRNYY